MHHGYGREDALTMFDLRFYLFKFLMSSVPSTDRYLFIYFIFKI